MCSGLLSLIIVLASCQKKSEVSAVYTSQCLHNIVYQYVAVKSKKPNQYLSFVTVRIDKGGDSTLVVLESVMPVINKNEEFIAYDSVLNVPVYIVGDANELVEGNSAVVPNDVKGYNQKLQRDPPLIYPKEFDGWAMSFKADKVRLFRANQLDDNYIKYCK